MSPLRQSRHAFRYEDELCSLPEGVTLRDWRKAPATAGPRSRLVRLRDRLRAVRRR
jgi:hypothetical protein